MAITANIAQNINTTQTQDFYFTVVFITEGIIDSGGFALSNIEISGSTDISISDLTLLYVEDAFAVITVNLPRLVSGGFSIGLTGTVTIDGVAETIDYQPKTINYDTTGVVANFATYDTTSPPTSATEIQIRLSTASIENGGIVVAQFDFDYSVPHFSETYVTVTPSDAVKGEAEAVGHEFKRWVVFVTVPETGEGAVVISIEANGIGFTHEAVQTEVRYAPDIPLVIEPFIE